MFEHRSGKSIAPEIAHDVNCPAAYGIADCIAALGCAPQHQTRTRPATTAADIALAARAARRRLADKADNTGRSRTAELIDAISVRIEPTPTTESGPVVIDHPDTPRENLRIRELLHAIAAPIAVEYGVTFTFRSDTCVQVNWR
jgi:hypothetical protein